MIDHLAGSPWAARALTPRTGRRVFCRAMAKRTSAVVVAGPDNGPLPLRGRTRRARGCRCLPPTGVVPVSSIERSRPGRGCDSARHDRGLSACTAPFWRKWPQRAWACARGGRPGRISSRLNRRIESAVRTARFAQPRSPGGQRVGGGIGTRPRYRSLRWKPACRA